MIGAARGTHKQCGCQLAIGNLPAEERFTKANILLPILSRAKVYKKHGMARVVCGVDDQGVQHDERCFAADMRELDRGVEMSIPDDRTGGVRTVLVFMWTVGPFADFLGLQSLRPYYESPSAHQFCGDCDFDTRHPMADRPFSFLRKATPVPGKPKSSAGAPLFGQRTLEMLQSQLAEARRCDDPAACLKKYGLKRTYYAWDPAYIPHANPCKSPRDALHLFPDGLLRSECAWLLFIFFRLGLDFARANAAIRAYRGFPPDVRIPPLVAKLKEGKGGKPRSEATIRMTGSQVMHFSLHR